ncbi:MAG TPA: CocE/NonD family hydrolase [Candidatus Thermoplasmatota archaeon]|nr:CocE/NonD family hydrolase [Candidatus Thermoplasmatota archaeon]
MHRSSIALVLAAAVLAPALAPLAHSSSHLPQVRTGVLASFDGTPIVYTLFTPAGASAEAPVPVVLMTHGWAGSRSTNASGSVARMLDAGFAVLTWDSRGFGESGGFVELNSPDHEVRDVSALLDMLAKDPKIALDGPGDPRVGMIGGSYAGGIQLLAGAFDARLDAIAPDIAWSDLRYSLAPNGVPKTFWIEVLFGAGLATGVANGLSPLNPAGPQALGYNTSLPAWWTHVHATNAANDEVLDGLAYRSPATYAGAAAVPTLVTSGWPDALFNANEAVANFLAVPDGTPAKLMLYCGGHSGCPYVSNTTHVTAMQVAWMTRWLHDDPSVATGAPVEWQTSDGSWREATGWPPASTTWATASGTGRLVSTPLPTGGGHPGLSAGGFSGSHDFAAVDRGVSSFVFTVLPPESSPREVTGIPRATVTVEGTGAEAFVFLRLVDLKTKRTLDEQTTPLRLPLGNGPAMATVDLVGVSYVLPAGHGLGLEVTTSDWIHATNRAPAAFDVSVDVSVPLV